MEEERRDNCRDNENRCRDRDEKRIERRDENNAPASTRINNNHTHQSSNNNAREIRFVTKFNIDLNVELFSDVDEDNVVQLNSLLFLP